MEEEEEESEVWALHNMFFKSQNIFYPLSMPHLFNVSEALKKKNTKTKKTQVLNFFPAFLCLSRLRRLASRLTGTQYAARRSYTCLNVHTHTPHPTHTPTHTQVPVNEFLVTCNTLLVGVPKVCLPPERLQSLPACQQRVFSL